MANLLCPFCRRTAGKARLERTSHGSFRCESCSRVFDSKLGVIGLEEQRIADSNVHFALPLERLDSTFARLSFYQLERVLDQLKAHPPHSMLIVGCGTGREFGLLARSCRRISAVDISAKVLEAAACEHLRLGLQGDIVLYDGQLLPYDDLEFEVVIAHHVLHHVEEPMTMLAEMLRVGSRQVVICEPAQTFARKAVVALGLRPRIEEDGMRVREFSIPALKSFARNNAATLKYSVSWYPKPLGLNPERWHLLLDRTHLSLPAVRFLIGSNHVLGPIVGTKVTAIIERKHP